MEFVPNFLTASIIILCWETIKTLHTFVVFVESLFSEFSWVKTIVINVILVLFYWQYKKKL